MPKAGMQNLKMRLLRSLPGCNIMAKGIEQRLRHLNQALQLVHAAAGTCKAFVHWRCILRRDVDRLVDGSIVGHGSIVDLGSRISSTRVAPVWTAIKLLIAMGATSTAWAIPAWAHGVLVAPLTVFATLLGLLAAITNCFFCLGSLLPTWIAVKLLCLPHPGNASTPWQRQPCFSLEICQDLHRELLLFLELRGDEVPQPLGLAEVFEESAELLQIVTNLLALGSHAELHHLAGSEVWKGFHIGRVENGYSMQTYAVSGNAAHQPRFQMSTWSWDVVVKDLDLSANSTVSWREDSRASAWFRCNSSSFKVDKVNLQKGKRIIIEMRSWNNCTQ